MLFSFKSTINTSNFHQPYLRVAFIYIDISIHLPLIHHLSQTTFTRKMFNSIFGSSKKATSEIETPSSLINYERIKYERISRNDWMAENSIEGDLTPRLLFRASYKSELDYLRKSNPTKEELDMILSKHIPFLRLTREGDTENIGYVESLSFVADCEPKWFSAQPVLLPDGVTKDANSGARKCWGERSGCLRAISPIS